MALSPNNETSFGDGVHAPTRSILASRSLRVVAAAVETTSCEVGCDFFFLESWAPVASVAISCVFETEEAG